MGLLVPPSQAAHDPEDPSGGKHEVNDQKPDLVSKLPKGGCPHLTPEAVCGSETGKERMASSQDHSNAKKPFFPKGKRDMNGWPQHKAPG